MTAIWQQHALARMTMASACIVFGLALSSCGPEPRPTDATTTSEVSGTAANASTVAPEVKADPAAMLAKLQEIDPGQTYVWEDAHEVSVKASTLPGISPGKMAIELSPTSATTRHFVGLHMPQAQGPITYRVKIWLKTTPATQVAIEMAGREARADSRPKNYAAGYLDLNAMSVSEPSSPDTKITNAVLATEGEWQVLSCTFTTDDGYFVLNIGMAADGSHLFLGDPQYGMTIGGIEVVLAK